MILFPLNSAIDMIKESLFQISQFLKEQKRYFWKTQLFGKIRHWLDPTLLKDTCSTFSVQKKITLINDSQIVTGLGL